MYYATLGQIDGGKIMLAMRINNEAMPLISFAFCVGLTIAAKFTITIVIDSQKYYHDRLSIS